jgi:uncharacterized membrane protein
MTEKEFLEALKEALEQEMDEQAVQENVSYYTQYIRGEIQKGIPEKQVIEELGDPWVIARSIIDSPSGQKDAAQGSFQGSSESAWNNSGYGTGEPDDEELRRMQKTLRRKMWMILIAFLLIVICVIAILTSLIRLFAPVIFFVIVIWLILSFLDRRR